MKVLIKDQDIETIKDYARLEFKKEPNLSRFSQEEMQFYLILRGLECFLSSKKVPANFELEVFKQEDSMPIDESGLEEMVEEVKQPS